MSAHCRQAGAVLRELGAAASLELLQKAKQRLFGDGDVPESVAARREHIARFARAHRLC